MYSFASFRLSAFVLGLGLLVGTAACNRDKDDNTSSLDTELRTTTEDQATGENDDAMTNDIIEQDTPADLSQRIDASSSAADRASSLSACATRTWDPATRTLTIDFGPTNCLCRDGRYRRGRIVALLTGPRWQPGSKVVITRDTYFVNDNQHLGTKTDSVTAYNEWDVRVRNAEVIFANGSGRHTWRADRHIVRTASAGVPTAFTVTGQASGTNRRGVGYTAQIQIPLVKRLETGCADVFVNGTVQITRSNGKTALLNYNPTAATPAPCDRTASVTVNEVTRTIQLR